MDKIEIRGVPDPYIGLDELIKQMDERGLSANAIDTPITIILKTTGRLLAGDLVDGVQHSPTREFNVIGYINGTDSQIINDMEGI